MECSKIKPINVDAKLSKKAAIIQVPIVIYF